MEGSALERFYPILNLFFLLLTAVVAKLKLTLCVCQEYYVL